ncbi:GNAT family N-acetyltransferase [Longispora sp. NPDC051575]|uniref:GNAT family N-acetyltransferase n=1 Tax=Longispora sp. NPDC051575 TaxID=3154943 RepID=UPI00341A9167
MTEFTIRPATVDDVEHFARIRAVVTPWLGASIAAQRSWYLSAPARARGIRLCAEVEGQVVGFATGGLNVTTSQVGASALTLLVHPGFRERGIGTALLTAAEEHLRSVGATQLQCGTNDDPKTLAWAERHGFRQGASERYSVIDPRVLPPQPPTPDGVTVVSLAEVTPEAVHELDTIAFADEPGDVPYDGIPFEEFVVKFWDAPDLDRYSSVVAIVDGVAVSSVLLDVNSETGWAMSGGTCTLPAYRGRGLAKLLKSVSLRRAAEVGVTAAYTSNDYTNLPMLAVNDWLGYRVTDRQWSYLKDLT